MMVVGWVAEAWERMFRISLESSVLLAIVTAASLVWGRRWPGWFGALVWGLVAIRLLVPVTPESPWSVFNFGKRERPAVLLLAQDSRPEGPTQARYQESAERKSTPISWIGNHTAAEVAGVVWLAGAAWLWGSALFRCRAARRRLALFPPVEDERLLDLLGECVRTVGLRRHLRLVEGPREEGIAVCGVLRGDRIVIPRGFRDRCSEAQIRGIFLHELGHVARWDLARNWVCLAVQALHWYHPLVWLAGRAFRSEQEAACDRFALGRLPSGDHAAYGRALLLAAERSCPLVSGAPVMVPFISPKTELKHRLTMILNPGTMHPLTQLSAVLVAAAIGLTVFPTAMTADERNPKIPAEAGPRDGEGAPKAGPRDGEGAPKAGPRDGEGAPKAGPKEGEGAPKAGPKDGEGAPKAGPKDGAPANQAALLNTKGGKMFKAYDKDGSGGVSAEEIFGMREGDRKPSRSEVRKMEDLVEELDADDNAKELSVTEFLRYLEIRSQGGDRG